MGARMRAVVADLEKKEICEQDTLSRWRVMGGGGGPRRLWILQWEVLGQ